MTHLAPKLDTEEDKFFEETEKLFKKTLESGDRATRASIQLTLLLGALTLLVGYFHPAVHAAVNTVLIVVIGVLAHGNMNIFIGAVSDMQKLINVRFKHVTNNYRAVRNVSLNQLDAIERNLKFLSEKYDRETKH